MKDYLPNIRIEKTIRTSLFVVTKVDDDNTVFAVLLSMLKGIITAFFRVSVSPVELPP